MAVVKNTWTLCLAVLVNMVFTRQGILWTIHNDTAKILKAGMPKVYVYTSAAKIICMKLYMCFHVQSSKRLIAKIGSEQEMK